jgi:hypothetical protein
MLTDWARGAAVLLLVAVACAGCRFPDACEAYTAPDGASAVTAGERGDRCRLTLALGARRYVLRTDAIVTEVGEQILDVEVTPCRGAGQPGTSSSASSSVKAFQFGDYCTTDVIAVEVESGEQLLVFEAKDATTPILR